MASSDWERIPAYCPFRYYYQHRGELCKCDQPYMCAFCVKHLYGKRTEGRETSIGVCCEYHVPQLNKYLKHCKSEDEKASAVKQAREQLAAEIGRDQEQEGLRQRVEDRIWSRLLSSSRRRGRSGLNGRDEDGDGDEDWMWT